MAVGIGIATYLNGILVMRFGMIKMVSVSTVIYTLISLIYVFLFHDKTNPDITVLVLFLASMLFTIGFLFGNINALAMQPIGHIAGIGAAIIGFITTIMAVPLATYLGRFINDTALPLFIGFALSGVLSLLLLQYLKFSDKKRIVEEESELKVQVILVKKNKKH